MVWLNDREGVNLAFYLSKLRMVSLEDATKPGLAIIKLGGGRTRTSSPHAYGPEGKAGH